MESIKGTVESLIASLKTRGKGGGREEIIRGAFSQKELQHLRVLPSRVPARVRIAVDSSAWLYYFNLRKKALTGKIAERMPEVKEIVFIIGTVE
jgi:hypothetical protein